MTKILTAMAAAVALTAGLSAAAAQDKPDTKAAPSVAGKWTLSVDSPHGAVAMSLSLKQEGKKVTGTFSGPHGDLAVEGEFTSGALKVATGDNAETGPITFNAKFKDGDTLTGYVSSQMGDMPLTAVRVKDGK